MIPCSHPPELRDRLLAIRSGLKLRKAETQYDCGMSAASRSSTVIRWEQEAIADDEAERLRQREEAERKKAERAGRMRRNACNDLPPCKGKWPRRRAGHGDTKRARKGGEGAAGPRRPRLPDTPD